MRSVRVRASREYDVLIEKGSLDRVGELTLGVRSPSRAVIVTDETVAPLYADRLERSLIAAGFEPALFTIPASESSKGADTYLSLISFLADSSITRSDCLFALGGGVVGDLCGFCAATYLRSIDYVQIPTTLLAMVDSSVGGKTAINIPEGKNLIGAFHQPSRVICDPDLLLTLDKEQFLCGMAEVLKYGIIEGGALFDSLESPSTLDIDSVIEACVRIKSRIVSLDETDTGERRLLNLGHTTAHAIESLSSFEIPHGIAVAIGTAIITRASHSLGLCDSATLDRVISTIEAHGLPTHSHFGARELFDAAMSDKKRHGDTISLVMPYSIGDVRVVEISISSLEDIFKRGS